MPTAPQVAVLQDGGRLHYAIPVALQRQKILARVFCDWYSAPGSLSRAAGKLLRALSRSSGQRLLDRYTPDLAAADIRTHPRLALRTDRNRKRNLPPHELFQTNARAAADWVRATGLGSANALFGFIRSIHPDLLRWAREQGMTTIGDQMIAPYPIEEAEDARQRERFPEFLTASHPPPEHFWADVERETWATLDHITCASAYVREGLMAQGIAPQRITVNPYPVPLEHFHLAARTARDPARPISVGFVGAVNLRKGTPWFWQVARRFDPARVRFTMIGPVQINPAAITKHKGPVELTGPVPRSQIPRLLQDMDIYFFPSTCEGSAGAVLEAMATGLPVVTTPNSGSLAEHGVSGYVYPYDALDAFEDAIRCLAANADLRHAFGQAARARVEQFNLDHFGRTFADMLNTLANSTTPRSIPATPAAKVS